MLTASLYSPLEKFLLGRPVEAQPYTKASCLGGEEFAFQVVLQRDGWDITPVQVDVYKRQLRFCVRVILRCRKRELGFSLKERSKDQRDAGPMPRDGARDVPLPGA